MGVAQVVRGDPLQHRREVAQEQRLVLVDGQAEGRVQRLQVHAARREAGALHLLPDAVGEVDELGRACALKAQAARDHRLLPGPQRFYQQIAHGRAFGVRGRSARQLLHRAREGDLDGARGGVGEDA